MNFFSNKMSLKNVLHLRNTLVLLMAGAFLSSCANMPEGDRMRAEGALIGGGGLGLLGGVLCDDNNRTACIAAGTGIGALGGYAVGDWQANDIGQRGRQNVQRENVISSLQQSNANMYNFNNQLNRQITQYEQKLRRGIYDREGVRRNLTIAQNNKKQLQSVVARARRDIGRIDPNQRMAYENELRQLEGKIQVLNYAISKLQGMSGQGRVGY